MAKSALLELVMGRIESDYSVKFPNHSTTDLFTYAMLKCVDDLNNGIDDELNKIDMVEEIAEAENLFLSHKINVESALVTFLKLFGDPEYNVSGRDLGFSIMQYSANTKAGKLNTPVKTNYFLELVLDSPSKLLAEVVKQSADDTSLNDDDDIDSLIDDINSELDDILSDSNAPFDESGDIDEDSQDIDPFEPDSTEEDINENGAPHVETLAERFARLAAEASGAEKPLVKPKRAASEEVSLDSSVYKTKRVQDYLYENIFGQDHAISAFISAYFQSELVALMQENRTRPRAMFLFAGPPGVGKTFLAEQVASQLKMSFKRFDMSEFSDKEAHLQLCGMDKTYKNSHEGVLTSFVSEHKKSILLFDEIEKAHTNVIYLFLQMLDAGRLRDNCTNEEVSFIDTIIIFTTNAGKQLYEDTSIVNLSSVSKKSVLNALSNDINPATGAPFFPRAICSRFASGNIVMFNYLTAYDLIKIVNKEFDKQVKGFKEKAKVEIEIDPKIAYALLFAEGGKADARIMRGKSSNFIYQELFELFRLAVSDKYKIDAKKIKNIKIGLKLPDDDEITSLFVENEKPRVLIFTDEEYISQISKSLGSEVELFFADTIERAKDILCSESISIVLCDVLCGKSNSDDNLLNLEDIESEGRAFIDYLNNNFDIPYYLLERSDCSISKEEFLSFSKEGARDKIRLGGRNFKRDIMLAADMLYQQYKLNQLARSNKVLNFNTLQTISADGTCATIDLYGFNLKTAVDAEDNSSILSGLSKPDLRFSEIIGAKDAKEELTYFVKFLKDPVGYLKKGVKAPRGVLLYGPPGTGKTMLAKAMAGESDVTFISAEGNQFLKRFVGEGPEKVHELFNVARKYAPSILFIDEIDAIAKSRMGEGSDASSDVLTSFLTEMDGFNSKSDKPVFVLAATNYNIEQDTARSLDPALLRRFDRKILVDLPNKDERVQFIRLKISKVQTIKLSENQIENIAVRSTGMSLAELDNVFEYALRNSIKHSEEFVGDEAIEEAFESYNSGEVKSWDKSTLLRTARHEAGHALMCWLGGEKPSYLTIVARGNHGGYMQHGDNENKGLYLKDELIARVRTSLAGRAAEVVYYGDKDGISTGASGDLASATRLVEQIICTYGMDDKIGLSSIDLDKISYSPYYSVVKGRIDEILSEQFNYTKEIISKYRYAIDKLVDVLVEKSHIKGDDIDKILSENVVK